MQVDRLLQLVFGLMCCVSGLLLGFCQQDWTLAIVAFASATLGWIFSDRLKLIVLPGSVANLLSAVVLVIAMRNFFGGNSGTQLLAVANLLVYLQMVLLFQKKTPRLYWQLSVLSLLQVVVATIFNIQFEGSLFFMLYMLLSATALALLTIYDQSYRVKQHGSFVNRRMTTQLSGSSVVVVDSTPLAVFDQTANDKRVLRRMLRQLLMWLAVSLVFAAILFYKIPRTDSAWYGSRVVHMAGTGASRSLELDERGVVRQSNRIVMRAKFSDPKSGEVVRLSQPPYFRGLALSDVRVEDGQTTFRAPYDRVYYDVFEELSHNRSAKHRIRMDVVLSPTKDPLIYGCMPVYRSRASSSMTIDFCHELSALTRRREGKLIEVAPFHYSLITVSPFPNSLPKNWSYKPESPTPLARSMRGNRAQWEWLTQIDRDQYPGLIKLADLIAERVDDPDNFLELARRMSSFFRVSGDYAYTLDFSDVQRDETLDPIEDFIVNHKTGHCSMYAAGLCMMLRSQGIPSRVVVGYYGGAYNELEDVYTVTGKHAHAWVEAYIPPEDCSTLLSSSKLIGERGAWLTLDATPQTPYDFSASEDAIDMARTLWQGYVLGLDEDQQSTGWVSEDSKLLGLFDISNWSEGLKGAADEYRTNPLWKLGISIVALIILTMSTIKSAKRAVQLNANKPTSRIRKFVGRAVSLIAPGLGTWLIHGAAVPTVPFYEKLLAVLERHGHRRQANQTHREFAEQVVEHYRNHAQAPFIHKVLTQFTERFNQVRFGESGVAATINREFESDLRNLKSILGKDTELKLEHA